MLATEATVTTVVTLVTGGSVHTRVRGPLVFTDDYV